MDKNPVFRHKTIATQNFIDKVELAETEKKYYVLYFGRYSREKGIVTLLKACKAIPGIPFVFAGSGSLEDMVNQISNIKM